jgi:hypothetical protein
VINIVGPLSGGLYKGRERAENCMRIDKNYCPDEDWRVVHVAVVDLELLEDSKPIWEDYEPLSGDAEDVKTGDVGYIVTFFDDETLLNQVGVLRLRD